MAAIPDTGRFEQISLPRLLVDLYRRQFDGRVEVGRQRVEHTFLFASGVAVGCESPASKNGLCDQLLAAGTITQEDRDRAVSLIESKGCKEATALLELGLLDPRGLVGALRDQVRIRLLECMAWPKGAFTLDAGPPPAEAANPFRIDVYEVAQAGIEAHWRADQVLLDLEPKIARFASRNDRFASTLERLESDDALAAFAEALDGEHSFWEALKRATTPRSLAAAWVLDVAGALDYSVESAASSEEIPTDIEIVFTDYANAQAEKSAARESAGDRNAKPTESKAAAALRAEITSRFEKLRDLDHYQMLGLGDAASEAEIKASYLQAAKRYHPDALAKAGLESQTRQQANAVFAKISKAYSVLSNKRRRAEYDEAKNASEGPIDAERLASAESMYRKGEVLMRSGNFAGAIEFLRPAVELWPDESDYCAALGWALYRKMPSEPELARKQLERAVELAPESASAIHRLSVVTRSLGEDEKADSLLKRARSIDPKIA
ncbi:MAG: DnaJ domain-containing protein [Deltaproteobacteria bacterium]|jgi:tetratricopeptide (TPR) repeat protein|nr:DnaJ domain-containing protein [Deltaproteobacteria bacterium]MBW2541766.1 DnaJ domain-containing protein [Deltaproteobacteria bacterium]